MERRVNLDFKFSDNYSNQPSAIGLCKFATVLEQSFLSLSGQVNASGKNSQRAG